jgi:hypothetical protein
LRRPARYRRVLLLGLLCLAACVDPGSGTDESRPATRDRQAGGNQLATDDTPPAAGARFVTAGDDVVEDSRSGLVWTRREQVGNLPWPEADQHCRDVALAGRADWRLPEIDELSALYDTDVSTPCGERVCHLDPTFTLTSPYVWSGTAREGSRRFYLDYTFGTRLAPIIRPTLKRHIFCVHDG